MTAANHTDLPRWTYGAVPAATRAAVYLRDGFRCVYCLRAGDLSVDHIVPQSVFVDHRETNLVTCCMECNGTRGVIDCDLFCMHVARRTREPWERIHGRVLAAIGG